MGLTSLERDFLHAARDGDLEKLKHCVEMDVDVNTYEHVIFMHSHETAIDMCCKQKHFDCVAYLITCADIRPPQAKYVYPLLQEKKFGLFKELLGIGLDVNSVYNVKKDQGTIFLIESIVAGDHGAFDFLIHQKDIDLNADVFGNTPLLSAFENHRWDMADQLIEKQLDVNGQDSNGLSIFMKLAKKMDQGNLERFLTYQPNWDLMDHRGKTVVDHARADNQVFLENTRLSKDIDIITYTREAGGRVIQDIFNFKTHEKNMLVRKSITGTVETFAYAPFENVARQALQIAFNEHVKRGGTTSANDIGVVKELEKLKSPMIKNTGGLKTGVAK